MKRGEEFSFAASAASHGPAGGWLGGEEISCWRKKHMATHLTGISGAVGEADRRRPTFRFCDSLMNRVQVHQRAANSDRRCSSRPPRPVARGSVRAL